MREETALVPGETALVREETALVPGETALVREETALVREGTGPERQQSTLQPEQADLKVWALSCLGLVHKQNAVTVIPLAGDASARRYFRMRCEGSSWMLALSPPATQNNEAFVQVQQLLDNAGLPVPQLLHVELQQGYLLLEDLGDQCLLPLLNSNTVHRYYTQAGELLCDLAAVETDQWALPQYDAGVLREELSRFPKWFITNLLGYAMSQRQCEMLERMFTQLIANALEQPQVFVHRDFHSRNLMVRTGGEYALIDFQDAVVGPITYDLVSLLRDCYISWPSEQVAGWALAQRDRLCAANLLDAVSDEKFLRWFDWMGLQRHLKVLGNFARLALRDDKPNYLQDIPLVLQYVQEVLGNYVDEEPVFAEFSQWYEEQLGPLIAQQAWNSAA